MQKTVPGYIKSRFYTTLPIVLLAIAFLPVTVQSNDTPEPTPISIMQIQGSEQFSEFDKKLVETTGIVTLYNSSRSSFWMQDPNGDGSPATSDGIFVSGGGFPKQGTKPKVGDLIRIIAEVQEQKFGTALPLTRLRRVKHIKVISQNNPLPLAIKLDMLPSESITQGIEFWEALEGMLVSVSDATVVAPTTRFGEFAILTKQNRKLKSGYFSETKQLLIRSTGDQQVDYNPERILVDDSSIQNPIIVQPGDEIESLLAVVDYTFSNYKLQPVHFQVEIESSLAETQKIEQEQNRLSLATFNVENLFDLENNPDKNDQSSTPTPAELETKLSKLTLAIQRELHLPDIIVIQEIENTKILQTLADRINAQSKTQYEGVSYESSDARGIEVGFLWNKAKVGLKTSHQLSGNAVELAFGTHSDSPGREPLVGVFDFNGYEITVIGNHFKSKGGDDALYGIHQPAIRDSEIQRKLQAHAVRDYVDILLTANPKANIVVAGDFNDFQFAEPGEGDDHPLAILTGDTDLVLHNLINKVKQSKRFTYIYDGNAQVLDHILVSTALQEQLKKIQISHFNANSAAVHSIDPLIPNRSSDHDPVTVMFKFE